MAGQEEIQQPQAIAPDPAPQAETPAKPVDMHARHHDPLRHSPYYYKSFWGSYKGMVKGILGGLLIGAAVGVAIGALTSVLLPLVLTTSAMTALTTALTAEGISLAGACAAAFGAFGMLKGMHMFTQAGAAAGANAAVAEVQERRILEGVSQIVSKAVGRPVPAPSSAHGAAPDKNGINEDNAHETESPHLYSSTEPNSRLFHGKIGLTGLLVGLAAGALLAYAAAPLALLAGEAGALGFLGHALGHISLAGAMTVCGLYGASYGIDRNVFRRAFDFTDKLFIGRFFTRDSASFSHDHQVTEKLPEKYVAASRPASGVTAEEAALLSQLQRGPKDESWKARLAAAEQQFQTLDPTNARMH